MPQFKNGPVGIDYLDEGEGAPVVLVHGFASNKTVNWVNTSWVDTLVKSGRRAIALDNRGHGASEKLYDPQDYVASTMAGDVVALIDHLELPKVTLLGYSMGARLSTFATLLAPERVSALILSGLASALVEGLGNGEAISEALLAESADSVADPTARGFRTFAEKTKSDRKALAACIRASRQTLEPERIGTIAVPALIVAGDRDEIAGSPEELAAMMQDARPVSLPGRDHMTAVGDKGHKQAVLAFLDGHGI